MKKNIPNILTSLRILCIPLIIFFGFQNQISYLIILSIVISLTDSLDGYLARKWEVVSVFGAKLDALGDKLFALSLLVVLMNYRIIFLYLLIMEVLIGLTGVIIYYKRGLVNTLLIGKIKTWTLFISLVLGLIYYISGMFEILTSIMIIITFILQLCSLFFYIKNYLVLLNKKKN